MLYQPKSINLNESVAKLGFGLGISFTVGEFGEILDLKLSKSAKEKAENVYVAILKRNGRCLKIGMTNNSIWARWKPIIRMIDTTLKLSFLRTNEVVDQRRLREVCFNQEIEVWHRTAFEILMKHRDGELIKVRSAQASEIYLDNLFNPIFGKDLSGRKS